ncbi:multicopper oxidase family protein [Sediminibacterium sp.]|uniref:multicopper oxidase family protein n=1 Tax=Sediminibacterium sp. TaxID=1917865 RepID=UPI0027329DE5|nr:multicopper oxidase domain-containing protein [Sediminibacterium sp.]MDP3392513.1 multicopper oxidase domain-containing protein [Sediminibacterium sp.]MDP3565779.1 multicopper oxidase domain-containing protein [Sediminibacterium sp.]
MRIDSNKLSRIVVIVFFVFVANYLVAQKRVRYDLFVKDTMVSFAGKTKRAIAVNGQIPMPTLTFTEGDTAEILVHNLLNEPTSLHWHGLFLPNKEDGVPFLTQMPIAPGAQHLYEFPIIQNGTHWYHSHSGLQEQIGMYGSMVLNKRSSDTSFRKGIDDLPTIPIILSEWTNYNPENVHRMLHNASDWFAIKKGTTQSYAEAIKAGHFKTKFKNEWKRMLAMDVSDIYYDAVLINGKEEIALSSFKAGDKIRLRVSNGGASTYFWLSYAGGPITVVASDGNDVVPVIADRLIIGVSETYDIIVTIPAANTSFELLATAEDRIKSASLFLGLGVKKRADPLPKLKYFEGMQMMNDMMKMNGDMDVMGMDMSMQKMDMNSVMYSESSDINTLNYTKLKSPVKTNLNAKAPVKEFRFELTGNMNRYVWSMDNKVLSESDKILIKKGEVVRITLYNNSMMRHPMHLHGHDFRVVNGQGDYAPLKNVLDIMPMETNTIEFEANTEGDWFFHCHILYHMMAGMNRVFSYEKQLDNPLLPNKKWAYKQLQKESNRFHLMAQNDFATNGNDGMAMIQNTRWSISSEWRLGYNDMHGYESETHIGRYIGRMQWLMPFIGFDWRFRKLGIHPVEKNIFGQKNTKDSRTQISLGLAYTLPLLVTLQTEVYHDGNIRIQLKREDIPISKRIRTAFMVNSDKEYMLSANYIVAKNAGLRIHYDSDMGFGIGFSMNY